jgi:general secretion pathway protein H
VHDDRAESTVCEWDHAAFRGRAVLSRLRARAGGLTLIEIMVVIAIIGIVTAVAVAGSMQLPSARLRRSAVMITSAIKVAYTRATATSRDLRLVMDLDNQKIWLEESDLPMLTQSRDKTGTGGADPVTTAEQAAVAEGAKIVKGPPIPKPRFHPIEAYGFGDLESGKGGRPLQNGIAFLSVQSEHDDAPRTEGRAYLYFWPGGRTERAAVQLRIGKSPRLDQALTMLVAPLTGKVTMKNGAVDLQIPTDDSQASEREDTGF